MSDRLNFPIWADADTTSTGFTLQHLVNGSWVNTNMRTCALPAGYTNEVCLNRYIEKDIKSTAPDLNYSGTTGVTPQPDAYQVYRMVIDGVETREMGFINDWSYEEWSGEQRCLSAPINRHADSRQKLVYGNFAETGNSIIVKEMVQADIKMQPNSISIGAEQYQTITIVVTSNTSFELILPEWLTASQTAFTSGTTVAYLYPQVNTGFDSRQFDILAKHESYWEPGYEYTTLAHVAQSGKVAYLTIYPDPLGVAWDATGLTSVTVYTNTDFTATTNSSDTWLTYSGKTEVGTNYYNVYFNVSANTGDDRQTHVYFEYLVNSSGGTYTRALRVVQAHVPILTVEPLSREVDYTAQGIRIRVESDTNWTASSSESWISVPASGTSGMSLIFVDVSENSNIGAEPRSGSVLFSNGVKQATFSVVQSASTSANAIRYTSTDNTVIVPSNTGAFGATYVNSVYYPELHVGYLLFESEPTAIGGTAFEGKTKLASIEIPNTVTSIGIKAFSGCTSLTSIEIPSSVRTIGTLTMPIGTQTISKYYALGAFNGCTNLSAVTLSEGLQSLGHGTFYNCNITEISLPKTCKRAGLGAFGYSAITINTYYDVEQIYGGWSGDGKTNGTYFIYNSDNSGYTMTVPDAMIHMDGFTFYDTPNLIPGLIWREKPSVPDGAVRYLSGKDLDFHRGLSGNTVGTKYIPFGDVYCSPKSGTTNAYYTQNTKGLFQFNIDYYPNFRTTMPNGVVAVYCNKSNQWDNGMQYLSAIAFADSFTTIKADLRNNYESSSYFYIPLRQIYFGTGMTICNLSASTTELYELDFRNTQVQTITGVWQIGDSNRHRNINIRLPRTLTTLKPYLREMYYPAFYYEGTMAEWGNVNFSPVSVLSGTTYIIHCSDGDVTVTF